MLGTPNLFLVYQVERKIDLVYGGGSVGLMGLISQTVFSGGCHVLGYAAAFAPKFMAFKQIYISVLSIMLLILSFHS